MRFGLFVCLACLCAALPALADTVSSDRGFTVVVQTGCQLEEARLQSCEKQLRTAHVHKVACNSRAEEKGLKAGDQLKWLNGVHVSEISADALHDLLEDLRDADGKAMVDIVVVRQEGGRTTRHHLTFAPAPYPARCTAERI
jgi:hypothetical protein